jgi:hypothetical protein
MTVDLRGRSNPVYYWEQLPSAIQEEWRTVLCDEFDLIEVVADLINRENTPKTLGEWEEWVYRQQA